MDRTTRLVLRWSWRDLRRRWGLVVLTAVITAIGTGTYAGLGGTTAWRLRSNDASYAALRFHDVRARLPENTDVASGTLSAAVRSIRHASVVTTVEERLVVPVQVDASTAGSVILVPGEVIGMSLDGDVDLLHVIAGRAPQPGRAEAALDSKFVTARRLPSTGEVRLSGGQALRYTGTGYTPEYFRVVGGNRQLTGEQGFAVLFTSLATAQATTGKIDRVNDVVARVAPGADVAAVADELGRALADHGATVDTAADDTVLRALYADARNDEKMWTFLSFLVLLGASFSAFNLVSRMVEAERRELGVGMALGAPTWRLAARPLLVGLQIALLGAGLGVGVGLLAGDAMRHVMSSALPLPVWITPFPTGKYVQAAFAGVAMPMLATLLPVRRALRVEPVDALRTVPTSGRSRSAGLAPLLRRLRRRSRHDHVVASMPLRNVLRAPRRSLLTALGIAAAITTLATVLGLLDSIDASFARSDAEMARTSPRRLEVTLSGFVPLDSAVVAAIAGSPTVDRVETGLRLGATLKHGAAEVDTLVQTVDFAGGMWTPSIRSGVAPIGRPGIVIAGKAAADLGVHAGDRVILTHPVRVGTSYHLVDSELVVAAIHPNPVRVFAYVDASQVDLFNLRGIVDAVIVEPKPGQSADAVKRALFGLPGVSSVQEVGVLKATLEQRMSQLTGILQILEGFALALALLIAINSASLAIEERRREQATMFAFGLPMRTVMLMLIAEAAITALAGTLLGIGGGLLALRWLLHLFTTDTVPELGVTALIGSTSIALTVCLGVGVAALAPLFAGRRLRRIDIPSTLRILE